MSNIETFCTKCGYPDPTLTMDGRLIIFVCQRCSHEALTANSVNDLEVRIDRKLILA